MPLQSIALQKKIQSRRVKGDRYRKTTDSQNSRAGLAVRVELLTVQYTSVMPVWCRLSQLISTTCDWSYRRFHLQRLTIAVWFVTIGLARLVQKQWQQKQAVWKEVTSLIVNADWFLQWWTEMNCNERMKVRMKGCRLAFGSRAAQDVGLLGED